VFHVHWPEVLLRGHSPVKTFGRVVLTALLIGRLWVTRTAVVRTAHNLGAHEELPAIQRRVLSAMDRITTLWIALNDETPFRADQVHETIPHGHYRPWYDKYPRAAMVPGRLAYVGLIRPYKNVDGLLRAFKDLDAAGVSLEIAGSPSADLAPVVTALAEADPRVRTALRYVSEEDIARLLGEAEVVVLPYREMLNSGGLLLALSLDRPVLVPSAPVNDRLAEEVGPGWVLRYEGELTASALGDALENARAAGRSDRPDLSGREWQDAGKAHAAAYRRAVALRRGR
jgi:beta-1,4-mannosyltransferase